ncbi:hypothetical protein [Geopsychrobacter electrodiphilus]|uniref:hypothetical protein n=1 Tax=Geopsychrobacter electrodiphilus TaxID=225196 RepID=UPI00036D7BBD|nr:hypothetical protein [Geopsychrobacter electrodiphilus]
MIMKQGVYLCLVATAIMMSGAQVASADVTAIYKMTSPKGNSTQTIHYKDKQHVRVDMASANAKHEMSMLKLDDKVYSITGKTVQDMGQLAGMMAAMGKGGKSNPGEQAPIKYEDTGKTETIAGIKGKVYRFVDHGKQHEVVLGQDKDLQAAVLGVVEISKSSFGMMAEDPTNRFQQDASIKSMALLRMDDVMRLQSMNKDHIQNSVFELPSKPQQLGGMGALLKSLGK